MDKKNKELTSSRKQWLRNMAMSVPARKPISEKRLAWLRARGSELSAKQTR